MSDRPAGTGDNYAKFMVRRRKYIEERDQDPIRKVRSEAWKALGDDAAEGPRVSASNEAEIALRAKLGMPEMPDDDFAGPAAPFFPSDARRVGLRRPASDI